MNRTPILLGDKFTRLLVLNQYVKAKWGTKIVMALCECDCGMEKEIPCNELISGRTKSCGCLNQELRIERGKTKFNKKHGMTNTREYHIWQNMIRRCTSPKVESYKNYGARGIKVCDRWLDFKEFYQDMGPSNGMSIDRIDNDGNYEPSNCRWATLEEQGNNRRTNRIFEIGGEKLTLSQIARRNGIPFDTLYRRVMYNHMSLDKALTEPLRKQKGWLCKRCGCRQERNG